MHAKHTPKLTALALAALACLAHGAQPLYPLANPQAPQPGQAPALLQAAVGKVDYSANAGAAQLVVEVARNGVPADGQTAVPVTVRVLGADAKPLATAVMVTLEASGGRILLPGAATDEAGPRGLDADPATPGVQLEVRQGLARFELLAPMAPQDVQLRVTAGTQEARGMVSFVPDMREMVALGLLEGVVNFSGGSGAVQPTRWNDAFDREIRNFSYAFNSDKRSLGMRSALFLKGIVKGEYLLTAAYDSDKETRSRLLSDIRPDEFYPVYGDASLKADDAPSASRLYLRVDRNKSYLLYGDFATGDGFSQRSGAGAVATVQQRSLGAYNRSATGLRLHHEAPGVVANVFAFTDTLRQVVEEFASQGSGPYGLRNNAVLQDSEKVEMVVRDRNQPARILGVTPLFRLADYTFEPFSGRIVLNRFLPAFDASLNPVSLRVTYEVDQGGDAFWVAGADGQLALTPQLAVGGSLVQDHNPLAGATLASLNLGWRLGGHTAVVAEVASTTTEVNTNTVNQSTLPGMSGRSGPVSGQAWRVEMAHEDERLQARVFLGQSDPTFNNPAAPLAGGRAELQASAAVKLSDSTKAYAEVQRSEDRNPGAADRDAAQAGVKLKLSERLVLDVGLRTLRESAGTATGSLPVPFASTAGLSSSLASGSGGGAAGFGNQPIDPLTGLPIIQGGTTPGGTTGGTNATALRSDTWRAGLGFKATERLTLGGEVEQDIHGEPRQRYALGGDYLLAERTRLYARGERQTGLASASAISTPARDSTALAFGVDTSYWRDTQLFSEYRLRDALSGRDNQLASGIRNGWDYAPGIRINTAYERTQVLSGSAAPTQAVSAGVDYTAHPLWRGATKLELRRSGDIATTLADNEAFTTTLWQGMLARKLDRDWTLLARNYLLQTGYARGGDVFQNRFQVGAAYRDTDTNRINGLAKYEYKTEHDTSNATTGALHSRAHIVSAHADWHPVRPWWVSGRLAAKWQNDQFEGGVKDSFRAQLLSGRVVYDITENWDLGLMAAVQLGQHSARQHAVGVEAGYLVRQNLWLSAGVNATGFQADRDLAGYEYTRSGVYVRLRFKFDENLFASNRKDVNRTLDR